MLTAEEHARLNRPRMEAIARGLQELERKRGILAQRLLAAEIAASTGRSARATRLLEKCRKLLQEIAVGEAALPPRQCVLCEAEPCRCEVKP